MTWVLLIGAVWLTVAVLAGVLIGRSIRLADRKNEDAAAAEAASPNFVVDPAPPARRQPATSDNVPPSVPPARTSSSAPALAEPPREPGPF